MPAKEHGERLSLWRGCIPIAVFEAALFRFALAAAKNSVESENTFR